MTAGTPRRQHIPRIPRGCDQQGRVVDGQRAPAPAECSTEIGADMPGVRAPLPNSVGRWARVLLGFIVCVFAAIGAGALVGFLTR